MKNLTTIIIATLIAILPISAFAHGIHFNEIDGHTHSLISILTDSMFIMISLASLAALFVVWRSKNG